MIIGQQSLIEDRSPHKMIKNAVADELILITGGGIQIATLNK